MNVTIKILLFLVMLHDYDNLDLADLDAKLSCQNLKTFTNLIT